MSVPDFQSLMLPTLKALADGSEAPVKDIRARVATSENLTPEDVQEMLPNGRQAVFVNRIGWAIFYMERAGLLERTRRGVYRLMSEGKGLTARGGQIIDATIVPVPKQRNRPKENEEIKQGKVPEDWQDNPHRLRQKDRDARWTKKNGVSHYGYKNSISIDAAYGFIRRHVLTPANIHDSQMLPALLDGENGDAMVWADSAYQSKLVDSFLKEAGYESRIHEKGSRHQPLDAAAKERNGERSKVRAKVEHVFGQMEMVMGGKLSRCIGLARAQTWWCLRDLVFNFLRFTQHKYGLVQV